jgi:hypothetical protein
MGSFRLRAGGGLCENSDIWNTHAARHFEKRWKGK